MNEPRWVNIPGEASASPDFSLEGISVWKSEWRALAADSISLPRHQHDSTPTSFGLYEITNGIDSATFAATEISPGGYSFYILKTDEEYAPLKKAEAIKDYLARKKYLS